MFSVGNYINSHYYSIRHLNESFNAHKLIHSCAVLHYYSRKLFEKCNNLFMKVELVAFEWINFVVFSNNHRWHSKVNWLFKRMISHLTNFSIWSCYQEHIWTWTQILSVIFIDIEEMVLFMRSARHLFLRLPQARHFFPFHPYSNSSEVFVSYFHFLDEKNQMKFPCYIFNHHFILSNLI